MLARGSTEHLINLGGQSLVLAAGLVTLSLGIWALLPTLKDPSRTTSWHDAFEKAWRLIPGVCAAGFGLRLIFLAAHTILAPPLPNGLLQLLWRALSV